MEELKQQRSELYVSIFLHGLSLELHSIRDHILAESSILSMNEAFARLQRIAKDQEKLFSVPSFPSRKNSTLAGSTSSRDRGGKGRG